MSRPAPRLRPASAIFPAAEASRPIGVHHWTPRVGLALALLASACPQLRDDDFVSAEAEPPVTAGSASGAAATSRAGSGSSATGGGDAGPGGGSCTDAARNQDETGVDCGGVCAPCRCVLGDFSSPEPLTGLALSGALWGASLSADGRTLALAHATATGEAIFIARRDLGASFFAATPATAINTATHQGTTFLSADGLSLYFYSIRGDVGGRDLYVATRASTGADFAGGTLLEGVNSAQTDHLPWLSADELTLYFTSQRDSSRSDIYVATRTSRGAPFSGVRAVDELSTDSTDENPALSEDGLAIFFDSDRGGNYDIWTATRERASEPFAPPAPAAALNDPSHDGNATLSRDGREIIFTSEREGTAKLYRSVRECR